MSNSIKTGVVVDEHQECKNRIPAIKLDEVDT